MRILYIDPVSYPQHLGFNKLQIKALRKSFQSVYFCFVEGYAIQLGIDDSNVIYSIPKNIINTQGGVNYRKSIYKALKAIKKNVKLDNYNIIIISCYDELALYFAKFPHSYLFNHNNIGNIISSKIKKFFYRKISKRHTQLVLTESSLQYLKQLGIDNVKLHSHGLPLPFDVIKENNSENQHGPFTVFVPSKSSTDSTFFSEIINNKEFEKWLTTNNIEFIIRSDDTYASRSNIKVISGFIPKNKYEEMFMTADCILVYYPYTFQYRISAILLECLANRKQCMIRDIPNFNEYRMFLKEEAFFKNIEDLKRSLILLKSGFKVTINESKIEKYFKIDYSYLSNKL